MKILFAWEMGHNYGHATQIAAVVKALSARRGVEIYMALKDPAAALPFLNDAKARLLPAPFHAPRAKRPPPQTYAEGLIPCGYAHEDELYPLLESWRSLYDLIKPAALVTQAAPTALLAARGERFKKFAFGRTFDMPPRAAPMPALAYWQKNDENAIKRREVAIVNVINKALARAGRKPVEKFCDILETDGDFLCAFRELDHYPVREGGDWLGPFFETSSGAKTEWTKKGDKKIFAYLRPGKPVFVAALAALRQLAKNNDVILAAPGLPKDAQEKFKSPSLQIVAGAARLDNILKKCDLAIHHGGGGLSAALAVAGIPALMLPQHIEQVMAARAAGRANLGRGLIGRVTPESVARKTSEILNDAKMAAAVKSFAARHKNYDPEKTARKIADEIYKAAV